MAQDAMMKQWRDLKAKHPDAVLLFRCGDFYESYDEDAKECARILGITLTYRNTDKTAMAGFPYHALDTYLPKLIRAGKRVAICDQLEDPRLRKTVKRGITELVTPYNNSNNNQNNQETMAQNNVKADLTVGTVIEIVGTTGKYIIKAIEGDKLTVDFIRKEGEAPTTMPMPKAMLDKMVQAGKWSIGTTTESKEPNASEDVEEVSDVQPEPAKTVKMEQPAKPKVTLRRKQSQPKGEKQQEPKTEQPKGKLTYSTYTNKNGKTCAKITGFAEGDAMLERSNAESIHASSTYERDKKGEKHYMLIFGPRYADAAKAVCQAMNEGKPLADCQAIIDQATEERAQKREEWKAKRAAYQERKAEQVQGSKVQGSNGYSNADVAEMLKKIMAGGDIPEDIKKAMAA